MGRNLLPILARILVFIIPFGCSDREQKAAQQSKAGPATVPATVIAETATVPERAAPPAVDVWAATWYSLITAKSDPAITDDPDEVYDPISVTQVHDSYSDPGFSREAAYEALLSTTHFVWSVVGAGAIGSAHAWSFRTILRQPDAKDVFEDLLKRGHLAGQLYALCGLYLVDRKVFEARVAPYRDNTMQIWTQYGCVMRRQRVCDVVDYRYREGTRVTIADHAKDLQGRTPKEQ